jgi:MFS family permease
MEEQKESLLAGAGASDASTRVVASPQRWWILATYSCMACLQGLTWSVPGALQPTYVRAYGVSADTVQLLLNFGPIAFLLAMAPFIFLIDRYGIRVPTLLGIGLVVASNVLRCFAHDGSALSLALIYISFLLNAAAGPAAMGIPSKLAEDWFPPLERTSATAIAALSNQAGVLFLWVFVPTVAPQPTAEDSTRLNLLLAALSIANACLAAWYFPSHPPVAPSASARVTHASEATVTPATLWASWRVMLANRAYVALLLTYSALTGVAGCTGALLTANLEKAGGTLLDAGYIGFAANLFALIGGVLLSLYVDRIKRHSRGALKAVLVGMCCLCGLCFTAYTVLLAGVIMPLGSPSVLWSAAISFCGATVAMGAAVPLMFEVAAEITFPEPEGAMLVLLTGGNNLVAFAVLLLPASSMLSLANAATGASGVLGALYLYLALPSSNPRMDYDSAHEGSKAGSDAEDKVHHDEQHEGGAAAA